VDWRRAARREGSARNEDGTRTRTACSEGSARNKDRTRTRTARSEGSAHNENRTRTRAVCSEGSARNKDRTRMAAGGQRAAGKARQEGCGEKAVVLYSGKQGNKLLREEGKGRKKERKKWATAPFKDIRRPLGITPLFLARTASLHIPSSRNLVGARIPVGAQGRGLAGTRRDSSGSAPIVTQQHSNEGVQTTGGGAPVADTILELVIAIQALGVAGQANLVNFLICQYCVVLIGTVTRCVGSTKARRRISYERKETSSSPLSSPICPSASPPSWMSGRSNAMRCNHSAPRVWQRASERKVQRMAGMPVRCCRRATVRSWRIHWAPIGS